MKVVGCWGWVCKITFLRLWGILRTLSPFWLSQNLIRTLLTAGKGNLYLGYGSAVQMFLMGFGPLAENSHGIQILVRLLIINQASGQN